MSGWFWCCRWTRAHYIEGRTSRCGWLVREELVDGGARERCATCLKTFGRRQGRWVGWGSG